jgi:hypothetical protein
MEPVPQIHHLQGGERGARRLPGRALELAACKAAAAGGPQGCSAPSNRAAAQQRQEAGPGGPAHLLDVPDVHAIVHAARHQPGDVWCPGHCQGAAPGRGGFTGRWQSSFCSHLSALPAPGAQPRQAATRPGRTAGAAQPGAATPPPTCVHRRAVLQLDPFVAHLAPGAGRVISQLRSGRARRRLLHRRRTCVQRQRSGGAGRMPWRTQCCQPPPHPIHAQTPHTHPPLCSRE